MRTTPRFLSTPSARRATSRDHRNSSTLKISIHALREEGDVGVAVFPNFVLSFLSTPSARRATRCPADACHTMGNFYPRPPRGGRPCRSVRVRRVMPFLSTPSARRATTKMRQYVEHGEISIHALREEGDLECLLMYLSLKYFYPRPPRGGRQKPAVHDFDQQTFLSTPSARRATHAAAVFQCLFPISIHALREEGDAV